VRVKPLGVYFVEAGFVTDGASIPRLLWPLIGHPIDPSYYPAAIVHDSLYCNQPVTRGCADAVFCRLLRRLGVARWRVALMYTGVRLGGWVGWSKKGAA